MSAKNSKALFYKYIFILLYKYIKIADSEINQNRH